MSKSNFTLPSGSATITSLAVLENPRTGESARTVHFDAQLFCIDDKHPDEPGILASLRYFNNKNYQFNELGAYFITAHVVRVIANNDHAPDVSSDDLTNADYCLVGDIISLIPASIDEVDGQHSPYMEATGYLTIGHKDEKQHTLTFELSPEPYTHAYKDYNKAGGAKKASLPLTCTISESPRWPFKSMPNLKPGYIISVSGFLSRVIRDGNNIRAFELTDIDQISILAKTTLPLPAPAVNQSPSGLKRKDGPLKFTFASPVAKRQRTASSQPPSSQDRQSGVAPSDGQSSLPPSSP